MQIGPKTWIIAQTKTVTRNKDGAAEIGLHLGVLTLVDGQGDRDVIPVFTTEGKAIEYVKATSLVSTATAIPVKNLGVLADFLERLLEIDFAQAIGVDPSSKFGNNQVLPLAEFLADLRSEMPPL